MALTGYYFVLITDVHRNISLAKIDRTKS